MNYFIYLKLIMTCFIKKHPPLIKCSNCALETLKFGRNGAKYKKISLSIYKSNCRNTVFELLIR